jgi:hypothetical protein
MQGTSIYVSFFAGLCLGGVLAAGYFTAARRASRAQPVKTLVKPRQFSGHREAGLDLKDEVIKENLSRNLLFFSSEGCSAQFNSHVVVIGLGGVGSHAAHLLLRSGVGKITLVDFDQVNSYSTF